MTIDLTKPVQTRDGRPARIICTDRKGAKPDFSVVALVMSASEQKESLLCFTVDGKTNPHDTTIHDLVNVSTKHSGWMNVVVNAAGVHCPDVRFYETREEAEEAHGARVACIHVTWEGPS